MQRTRRIPVRHRTERREDAARHRRGGQIVLPIVLVATVAIFEFSIIGLVADTVAASAAEGARQAAKVAAVTGDDAAGDTAVEQEVESVVEEFLGIYGLDLAANSGAAATVKTNRFGTVRTISLGDATVDCNPPDPASGRVAVAVCVELSQSGSPVPNLLSTFGFDISQKTMSAESLALIE